MAYRAIKATELLSNSKSFKTLEKALLDFIQACRLHMRKSMGKRTNKSDNWNIRANYYPHTLRKNSKEMFFICILYQDFPIPKRNPHMHNHSWYVLTKWKGNSKLILINFGDLFRSLDNITCKGINVCRSKALNMWDCSWFIQFQITDILNCFPAHILLPHTKLSLWEQCTNRMYEI